MSGQGRTYMPYVLLIYFFNALLLPHGLVYSAILAPVFIYWQYKHHSIAWLWWPLLILFALDVFYLYHGASPGDLLISSLLFLTFLIFGSTAWQWVVMGHLKEGVFEKLLRWNSLLVILSVLIFPFQWGRDLLWYEVPISPGVPVVPRLKLFTYEASYYALQFAPLFLFYFWRMLFVLERPRLLLALAIAVPLLLSMSFGVLACLAFSLVVVAAVHYRRLASLIHMRKLGLYGGAAALSLALMLLIFFPDNPFLERVSNIVSGSDTSARGRLYESFMFAKDLIAEHSVLLGVGPGQIKVFAHDLIINYYQYEGDYADIVRIPNSVAEWLATFGLVGLAAKLFFEAFFFFRFRLYENVFNFSLFVFIFVYQFTGSYLVSPAEAILWVVAIKGRFPTMDISKLISRRA